MPQVPVYTPQVEIKPLGAPQQSSVASTGMFNGNAEAAAAVGKGVTDLGTALTDIAIKEQEKKDLDAIFSRETALKEELIGYEADVRKNRQGRFAEGLVDDTQKWWDEKLKVHTESLTSERQRRIFGQRAAQLRTNSIGGMSKWSLDQLDRAQTESFVANRNTEVSLAAQNVQAAKTPEELANALNTGRIQLEKINQAQALHKGWNPDVLESENRKATTDLYVASIRNIVDTNPTGAKGLLESAKANKLIDGRMLDDLERLVRTGGIKQTAQTAADYVVAQGMDEAKALEYARGKYEGEEEAAVVSEIKTRFGEREQIRSRAERDAYKKAWDIADKTGRYNAIPADVLNTMDPHQRAVLREHLENKAKGKAVRTDMNVWLDVQQKILKGEITDPMQLKQYQTQLSSSDIQEFAGKLAKPEKIIEARIDKQDFDAIAEQAGLEPFKPKKTEQERAELGLLQKNIEDKISAEQAARKRQLTREEKQEIARREVSNTVLTGGLKVLGFQLGGTEKPVGAVTAGANVRVPESYRNAVLANARAKGIPTSGKGPDGKPIDTDALVRDAWLRETQQKRNEYK